MSKPASARGGLPGPSESGPASALSSPGSPSPGRVLALDLGSVRTGVAISDELRLLAHPRPALGGMGPALLESLKDLVRENAVSEIVVGLPLTLAGSASRQTETCRDFARRIRSAVGLPVTLVDERLSTVSAGRTGTGGRRDGSLDSAAAAVFLQARLDAGRTNVP